ncbi:DUF2891 domain-containing protein [Parerythrobacter jejuensis]|uniref:DUF2891 family protein n=1 Tax=Parerythrobacter jejuensis TaxID=795812 RepID=A0A845APV1_9SPHN|nr:DUF2891 domain-containing protein [Parerythrobacter jejuensis]MXP31417.1 DUF2891 family protein [Parerythrobacter jejuensis]
MELTEDIARNFARIALGHVAREYPNKLDHVMASNADAQTPRALHPCFFGSYDWHSCVHGWWTLLTLRRLYPDMPEAADITQSAEATFTTQKLAVEAAYLDRPESRGFERPYGWGWLLFLHHEASRHADCEWAARMGPLARKFATMLRGYLEVLTYPITVGTHFNTAFALVLAREWAVARDPELVDAIDSWSLRVFSDRADYRGWEPGGDEFLSPALMAALLMRRVMPQDEFRAWYRAFMPAGRMEEMFSPADVSDRSDGKIAHLDGLNLSRAWCLREISAGMGEAEGSGPMQEMGRRHLDAAMPHVAGDYMGEHWLASFALLALLAPH